MEQVVNHGHGLHRAIYISRVADIAADALDAEVEAIVAVSRRNNVAQGVTGLLLAHEGFFVQALEGSHATISALIERIGRDPRHTDLRVVGDDFAPRRLFGRWAMRAGKRLGPGATAAFDPYAMSARDLTATLSFSATIGAGPRRAAA